MLLALVKKGVTREDAYTMVQRNAMQTWEANKDFKALLKEDKEMIEDLILVAINHAMSNADKKAEDMMKNVTGGALPNFNMPGF